MNIGELKVDRTVENRESITGRILTFHLDAALRLETNENRQGEKSPTHVILVKSPVHGQYVQAGSAWSGITRDGSSYYSMAVEIPGVMEGFRCTAWSTNQPGAFEIRADRKKETPQEQVAA